MSDQESWYLDELGFLQIPALDVDVKFHSYLLSPLKLEDGPVWRLFDHLIWHNRLHLPFIFILMSLLVKVGEPLIGQQGIHRNQRELRRVLQLFDSSVVLYIGPHDDLEASKPEDWLNVLQNREIISRFLYFPALVTLRDDFKAGHVDTWLC
jgi:hypothetical protein